MWQGNRNRPNVCGGGIEISVADQAQRTKRNGSWREQLSAPTERRTGEQITILFCGQHRANSRGFNPSTFTIVPRMEPRLRKLIGPCSAQMTGSLASSTCWWTCPDYWAPTCQMLQLLLLPQQPAQQQGQRELASWWCRQPQATERILLNLLQEMRVGLARKSLQSDEKLLGILFQSGRRAPSEQRASSLRTMSWALALHKKMLRSCCQRCCSVSNVLTPA